MKLLYLQFLSFNKFSLLRLQRMCYYVNSKTHALQFFFGGCFVCFLFLVLFLLILALMYCGETHLSLVGGRLSPKTVPAGRRCWKNVTGKRIVVIYGNAIIIQPPGRIRRRWKGWGWGVLNPFKTKRIEPQRNKWVRNMVWNQRSATVWTQVTHCVLREAKTT